MKSVESLKDGSFFSSKKDLIGENLNLIHYVLSKMNNINDQYEDLFQEGVIGLINASNTYNISKNIKFSNYAYCCIRNEIFHYIRKNCINQFYVENEVLDNMLVLQNIHDNELSALDILIKEGEHNKILDIINLKLSDLERKIICMSYGIACKKLKQKEIQIMLDLKQYQISRIKKKAINVIKLYV